MANNYTVQDLQDNLDYLSQTKTVIKQAIVSKGQIIDENTPFRQYAQKIANIQTGTDTSDANAVASNILENKTAYVKGQKIVGSMPNNGSLNYTPSSTSQSIPAGYTTGGTISAVDITTLDDYQTCESIVDEILGGDIV